jgi:hypothetical protein
MIATDHVSVDHRILDPRPLRGWRINAGGDPTHNDRGKQRGERVRSKRNSPKKNAPLR